jgi:hypothetical protein
MVTADLYRAGGFPARAFKRYAMMSESVSTREAEAAITYKWLAITLFGMLVPAAAALMVAHILSDGHSVALEKARQLEETLMRHIAAEVRMIGVQNQMLERLDSTLNEVRREMAAASGVK